MLVPAVKVRFCLRLLPKLSVTVSVVDCDNIPKKSNYCDYKDETIATFGLKYIAEDTGCKSGYLFAIKTIDGSATKFNWQKNFF